MNMLKINMGYKPGEKILVLYQEWAEHLGEKEEFDATKFMALKTYEVFKNNNIDVKLFNYIPGIARNGVDATEDVYQNSRGFDIVFMITAYSLTHTAFRKSLTDAGARVASMPGFTIEMLETLKEDHSVLAKYCEEVAEKLKFGKVRITGEETDMLVVPNNDLILTSSGLAINGGDCENLPGAETFCVPEFAEGHFTCPVGWGGDTPLKFKAKFIVKNTKIAEIIGETEEAQTYIDEFVKPKVFGGENFNILAELGIGLNNSITGDYLKKVGWSSLLAEKIGGSAHFANGNSKGMGGTNNVPVHIDWVVPDVKIEYGL